MYVMATRTDDQVPAGLYTAQPGQGHDRAKSGQGRWKRMSCGDGAHGPRVYDWAGRRSAATSPHERRGWVLARRSITTGDIAYYRCFGRAGDPAV